jgi:putative DNA primase/helicase
LRDATTDPKTYTNDDRPPITDVPEGQRNDRLFKEACALIGRGYTRDHVLTLCLEVNAGWTKPLSPDEVERIVDSASKYEPNPELAKQLRNDDGNAERLILRYGGMFRFCEDWNQWLIWDGRRYETGGPGRVYRWAQLTMRETREVAVALKDEKFIEFANKSLAFSKIKYMVDSAKVKDGVYVTPEELDANPALFNVLNGTLNLDTLEFTEGHDPDRLLTKVANVKYDPNATAPRWEQFLNEVFEGRADEIAYVQALLGYMLTADTSEQKIWIAVGLGANGKSTLFDRFRELVGDYGAATKFDMFGGESENAKNEDLFPLRGVRAVIAAESETTQRLAEARVKWVTGGSPIRCRPNYAVLWTEYEPQFKIVLHTNHKPNIRGMDVGIWRRIVLIPMTASFLGREDAQLRDKLRAEFPGILNWLLDGLRMWRATMEATGGKTGLIAPPRFEAAKQDYKVESDVVGQWLDARCITKEDDGNPIVAVEFAKYIYADFRQWCKDELGMEDRYIISSKAMFQQLTERGFDKDLKSAGTRFFGIRLKPMTFSAKDDGEIAR